jgi:ferrous iron transport protein A
MHSHAEHGNEQKTNTQARMSHKIHTLKRGDVARITSFDPLGDLAYRSRLLAMGLTPGTVFQVSRMAPLGDPIEIILRGYALSLRKAEAQILNIEMVDPNNKPRAGKYVL